MWSFIIAAIGITSMWLAGGRYKRAGWGLALTNQCIWIVYAMVTEQYGFVFGAAAAGIVFTRNLWRVRG